MSRSLRVGLVWRFILVSTLPILLIGLVAYRFLASVTGEAIRSETRLITENLARQLEGEMVRAESTLLHLALFLETRGGLEARTQDLLDGIVQEVGFIESLCLLDGQGRVRAIGLERGRAARREELLGLDLSRHRFYTRARTGGAPVWSDTVLFLLTGRPTQALACPIQDGMIVATVRMSHFQAVLQKAVADPDRSLAVLDRKGYLVFHSARGRAERKEHLGHLPPVRAGLRGDQGLYRYRVDGGWRVGVLTRLSRIGWLLLVSQEEERALAPMRTTMVYLATGTVGALLLALLISLALSAQLAGFFRRLGESTQAVAVGNYDAPVPASGFREIDTVGRSFRAMAGEIRERERGLTLLAKSLVGYSQDNIYLAIVHETSNTFGVDGAFLSRLEEGGRIRTLAMVMDGQEVPEVVYRREGSPTDTVIRTGFLHVPREVDRLYPGDVELIEMGIQGYLGFALYDRTGTPIGILGAVSRRELPLSREARVVLEIIASRAEAEIEREEALRRRLELEEQLQQAQKMEALGRLAGGVAHDFNNILTGIIGYSEITLGELPPDAPLRAHLEQILQAGHRAADLTRRMLTFSRKAVLDPRVFDLCDLVQESRKMVQRIIGEDVNLTFELADRVCAVKGDPNQMSQVLLNLLVNARDALTRGGSIKVTVDRVGLYSLPGGRGQDFRPGTYILLAVEDDGCGMDADTRARVFEPFFTTKPAGKGTGLGLATVYGIVEQVGGHCLVESQPGAGSTFAIYLPEAGAPVPGLRCGEAQEAGGGSETILLVEDDSTVRNLASMGLRDMGYSLLVAGNGAEALDLAATTGRRLDLLVTDVIMPELDGRELYSRLSRRQPDLKVLYISGYAADRLDVHEVHAGSVDLLPKPFTRGDLARAVRRALDRGQSV